MYVYSVDPVTAAAMLLLPQPISVVCCCYAKLLLLPWALLVLCRINLLSFVRYGRVAEDQVLRLQVKVHIIETYAYAATFHVVTKALFICNDCLKIRGEDSSW